MCIAKSSKITAASEPEIHSWCTATNRYFLSEDEALVETGILIGLVGTVIAFRGFPFGLVKAGIRGKCLNVILWKTA